MAPQLMALTRAQGGLHGVQNAPSSMSFMGGQMIPCRARRRPQATPRRPAPRSIPQEGYMASADDPLANAYNIMGAQGLTDPNPYLEYTGQIPMAGFIGSRPTPRAIRSRAISKRGRGGRRAGAPAATPGTTLNSPASGAQFPTGSPLDQRQQSGASPAGCRRFQPDVTDDPRTNQTNPNMRRRDGDDGRRRRGGAGRLFRPPLSRPHSEQRRPISTRSPIPAR